MITGNHPLFAFIDPFGAKGVPFSLVAKLLQSPCSEILLNLDTDGIARILHDEQSLHRNDTMTTIFGDESWKQCFVKQNFKDSCRKALEIYISRLRAINNVKYVFAFEMRTSDNTLNYHLVFASKHPLGLEKMKEAMKLIDQTGDYCFADANVSQTKLFRFDSPENYIEILHKAYCGKITTYDELRDFALNHTPFINPKKMLEQLEKIDWIKVNSNAPRRRGTFNPEKITSIEFLKKA